jgi:hypothetical protein
VSVPKWIRVSAGPVLVSALLVGAVLGGFIMSADQDVAEASGCRADPETVRAIRAAVILIEHPRLTRLDDVEESVTCGSPGSFGMVSRRLTEPPTGTDVGRFYAGLAERSGWKPFEFSSQPYSATKETGGCPWWFLVRAEGDAYRLRVLYQPLGVPADDCAWATGEPLFLQASIPIGR